MRWLNLEQFLRVHWLTPFDIWTFKLGQSNTSNNRVLYAFRKIACMYNNNLQFNIVIVEYQLISCLKVSHILWIKWTISISNTVFIFSYCIFSFENIFLYPPQGPSTMLKSTFTHKMIYLIALVYLTFFELSVKFFFRRICK